LYTVIKSPFVHKKSQENFEKKTHRRLIKVWDTDREVVDKWLRYVKQYVIGGVGMKAQIFEWAELGVTVAGKGELKKPSLSDRVLEAAGMATRDLEEDSRVDKSGSQPVSSMTTTTREGEVKDTEKAENVSEPSKA
jgi:small subunit ribosomal protein S10